MGRMSIDTRSRVVFLWQKGYKWKSIHERLVEEGIEVSKTSLYRLIKKFRETGSVHDNRTWKPPRKLEDIHLRFIGQVMADDDELVSHKLHDKLVRQFPNLSVSLRTVKRARRDLGWACKKNGTVH